MSQIDEFVRQWRSLPRDPGCKIPPKSAFNPAEVKELLPFIAIHERRGRFEMRGRLTGTAIDEMFGANYTNVNLFDIYDPSDHEFFANLHDNLLGIPCGARTQRHVFMPNGEHYRIDSVHLPMADDAGEPVYLFTLMSPQTVYTGDGATPAAGDHMATKGTIIEYLDLGYGLPAGS